jgi:hypothetical protein
MRSRLIVATTIALALTLTPVAAQWPRHVDTIVDERVDVERRKFLE